MYVRIYKFVRYRDDVRPGNAPQLQQYICSKVNLISEKLNSLLASFILLISILFLFNCVPKRSSQNDEHSSLYAARTN